MDSDFALNLRLLCGYHRSIAEVCRRLEVNRPQFNRWLSGQYRPSRHHFRRICDFFGVEEHEILLPAAAFADLVQVRARQWQRAEQTPRPEAPHLARLAQTGGDGMDRFLGSYHETYLSMAYPGKILRTLVTLVRRDGGVYYQRTERLREAPGQKPLHGLYRGVAHMLADRIFLNDYETLTGLEITQTVLIPTFRNRVVRLHGLRLGAAGRWDRVPVCARVVYDYLGRDVDLRRALRPCGLYDCDSPDISAEVRDAIANDVPPGDWHLKARG